MRKKNRKGVNSVWAIRPRKMSVQCAVDSVC